MPDSDDHVRRKYRYRIVVRSRLMTPIAHWVEGFEIEPDGANTTWWRL